MLMAASGSAPMRFYSFEIVIEKEPEDEGYSACSPGLPGCFSNRRTIEEARRNMREAIQQHMASLVAHGCRRAAGIEMDGYRDGQKAEVRMRLRREGDNAVFQNERVRY
jgi:predicted RNase H-like HicB family nuclease